MKMARKAQITQYGGPEIIDWIDADLPPPRPGEVTMRNTAVGLNFIDTYYRRGIYPVPLPSGLGLEAAGVIDAVGEGVSLLACLKQPIVGLASIKGRLPRAADHCARSSASNR